MASLKVAEIVVLTATAAAPLTGIVDTSEGDAAVVKLHTKLANNAWPARSCAPVVIVAVNRVLLARTTVGVNMVILPEYIQQGHEPGDD
jgi:hypothetical protein